MPEVPAPLHHVVQQERLDEKPLLQPYLENLCATLLQAPGDVHTLDRGQIFSKTFSKNFPVFGFVGMNLRN